jgi:hypothetical protein
MGTKAERQAARERVSTYHQAELAGLLTHIEAAVDRYRAREIDVCALDETIHHYHRAAEELWRFCFSGGGGATLSSSPASSTGWPPTQNPSTGGNAVRRDGAREPDLSSPWPGLPIMRLSPAVATRHHIERAYPPICATRRAEARRFSDRSILVILRFDRRLDWPVEVRSRWRGRLAGRAGRGYR